MTIGRKMDQAWKDAIAAGLKASGKIGHSLQTKIGAPIAASIGGAVGSARKNVGNSLIKNAGKIGSGVGIAKSAIKAPSTLGRAAVAGAIQTKFLSKTTRGHGFVGNARNAVSNSLLKQANKAVKGNRIKTLKTLGSGAKTAVKTGYLADKLGRKIKG